MKEQLKVEIISQAKAGDYSLILKMIDTMSPRLLDQIVTEEFKLNHADTYIGRELYVVKALQQDGKEALHPYADYVDAMIKFGDLSHNGMIATVSINETIITGGNHVDGWEFDKTLKEANQLQLTIVDPSSVKSFKFESEVTMKITGSALVGTTEEELIEDIRKQVNPTFVYCEVLNPKTVIDVQVTKEISNGNHRSNIN